MGKSKWNDFSNDDLLQLLRDLYIKNNIIPKCLELTKYNCPNIAVYKTRLNIKTYKELLILCKIPIIYNHNYSESYGINQLKNLYIELNRIPITTDLKERNFRPCIVWYLMHFNTFNNALKKAGIIENNYSKDEKVAISLKEIEQFITQYGKYPTVNEYDKFRKEGYARTKLERRLKMTWNQIHEKYFYNIPIKNKGKKNINKYTIEFGIERLVEFYNIINKVPSYEDFKSFNWYPTIDWYIEKFGSFDKALFNAKIKDNYFSIEDRINKSIDCIKKLSMDLNRYPTIKEYYELNSSECLRYNELKKYVKLNFNEICEKYIGEYKSNKQHYNISYQELYNDFVFVKNMFNCIPTKSQLNKYGKYKTGLYLSYFNTNSFNSIIQQFGFEPTNLSYYYTDDYLLSEFSRLYKLLGYAPTLYDIDNYLDITSATFLYRFKSIYSIYKILNIPNSKKRFCNIYYDKMNNKCYSHAEFIIGNFLIDSGFKIVKDFQYINILEQDNRLFDWKIDFIDKEYYVEYFGLYNLKETKNKIILNYIKKTRKKIRDLYKAGLINKCIFIFPSDLKTKSYEQLFESIINN